MTARLTLVLLLLVGGGVGQAETAVTARLKAEFKETYVYTTPVAVAGDADVSGEPVLVLEPMTITHSMTEDILAEARRAAAVKEAAKFSPLKGGTLLSFRRGDLGFWPNIVPVDATPVKKGTPLLAVDLLRIKW